MIFLEVRVTALDDVQALTSFRSRGTVKTSGRPCLSKLFPEALIEQIIDPSNMLLSQYY